MAGEPIKDAGYGLAVKKGDPLRDRISELIISYQDQGHFAMLKSRWMSTKCEDSSVDGGASGGVNQLGVNSFGSLFLVMSAGVIAAIFILNCEFLYRSYSMKGVKGDRSDSTTTVLSQINVRDVSERTSKDGNDANNNNGDGINNLTFEGDGVFYQEKKITNLDDKVDDGVIFDEPVEPVSSYTIRIPNTILRNEIQRKLKELKPVTFNTVL